MLLPAYHIGILDFTLFENHPKFMAQYQILDVEDGYLYSDKLCIKVLDLTQLEKAKQEPETNKKLLKWASIFKAETLEELEQLASGEEVFENMVVTMKKLSEDEKKKLEIQKLDLQLKKAVVEERYEDAVKLRDKLKELKK